MLGRLLVGGIMSSESVRLVGSGGFREAWCMGWVFVQLVVRVVVQLV